MRWIRVLLVIGTSLAAFCLFLVGLGVGIAYLLAWLLPGVEIGFALVAGAVFALGVLHLVLNVLSTVPHIQAQRESESRADADEDEQPDPPDPDEAIKGSWRPPRPPRRRRR